MKNYIAVMTLALALTVGGVSAKTVQISETEMKNIGIVLENPVAVTHTRSQHMPAKVMIPNYSQWVISAPLDGMVEIMFVAQGDNVEADQPLVQMNSPQLLENQGAYLQSLSRLSEAKRNMQRDKTLFEEGIVAERRYRQSLSQYQQIRTEVAMYRKRLKLAGMTEQAIKTLDRTHQLNSHLIITANKSGVVMKQFATAGQRLSAAEPLYKLAQLKPLWLEIHTPLEWAKKIRIGDKIQVCGQAIEGEIIAKGRQVHEADQGVMLRASIENETSHLTPGEFVEACFITLNQSGQFAVPRSAVVRMDTQTGVFVKADDGVRFLPVTILSEEGKTLNIKGNLTSSDQIVVQGTATLKAAWQGMGGE